MSQQAKLSLSTKDVIHIEGFQENASLFKNESTLRIRAILQQLQNACTASGMDLTEVMALMEQGIPCEVLQPGADDWKMGHIRLSLEFQPGLSSPISSPMSSPMSSQVTMQSPAVSDITPTLMDSDLDDSLGSSPDLDELEMADMMPDASLEESVNADLDLSGLSEMDSMSNGVGDDLSFDMDSQAVEAGDLNDLNSPWDLSDDLDEMLLTNGNL
jgi:KGK domain